jgi:hypothetical protein
MYFVFEDRDGYFSSEPKTFETLEEFVAWSLEVRLPRHRFIPPRTRESNRVYNDTDHYMIYTESDYD